MVRVLKTVKDRLILTLNGMPDPQAVRMGHQPVAIGCPCSGKRTGPARGSSRARDENP